MTWPFENDTSAITKKLAKKMARLTTIYGRARELGGNKHADA